MAHTIIEDLEKQRFLIQPQAPLTPEWLRSAETVRSVEGDYRRQGMDVSLTDPEPGERLELDVTCLNPTETITVFMDRPFLHQTIEGYDPFVDRSLVVVAPGSDHLGANFIQVFFPLDRPQPVVRMTGANVEYRIDEALWEEILEHYENEVSWAAEALQSLMISGVSVTYGSQAHHVPPHLQLQDVLQADSGATRGVGGVSTWTFDAEAIRWSRGEEPSSPAAQQVQTRYERDLDVLEQAITAVYTRNGMTAGVLMGDGSRELDVTANSETEDTLTFVQGLKGFHQTVENFYPWEDKAIVISAPFATDAAVPTVVARTGAPGLFQIGEGPSENLIRLSSAAWELALQASDGDATAAAQAVAAAVEERMVFILNPTGQLVPRSIADALPGGHGSVEPLAHSDELFLS
ncbi:hypothetical protein FHS85_001038 [Rhodoligotrophos appendicifer]|uniref:hypothetical protein n=1 Tax=Rhodoligotrophos appendicifer TaxID=987056 RepID=UPI00117F825B|nr:hypothetical protein [Rhodoligotrophos appendicifer]